VQTWWRLLYFTGPMLSSLVNQMYNKTYRGGRDTEEGRHFITSSIWGGDSTGMGPDHPPPLTPRLLKALN
jgi:hypothetical protein